MIKYPLLFLAIFLVIQINAQTFSQLTNAGSANKVGSNPANYITIGITTFFTANDGVHGIELWKTDGTDTGTVMVKDINAGINSSSPFYFTNLNGILMFAANNGVNGNELWRSNGTDTGTYMVKDIRPGVNSGMLKGQYLKDNGSDNFTPLVINNIMYFVGSDPIAGVEIFKTDGTAAGTMLIKDIFPGTLYYPALGYFCNLNDILYFCYNSGNGYQIWKSDGTDVGTVKVTDINSFTAQYLTKTNNFLYFISSGDLWRTDGTVSGTKYLFTYSSINGQSLTANGNNIYYVANFGYGNELHKTDGILSGNGLIKDIYPGPSSSSPQSLVNIGSNIYFSAYTPTYGRELWKTDGTSLGTELVKDIYPGVFDGLVEKSLELYNINDTLYFKAEDGVNGFELWKSNGTSVGTGMVADIASGGFGSNPYSCMARPGGFVFTATNGTNGFELWKSDGLPSGTVMLHDIRLPANDVGESSIENVSIYNYVNIDKTLYFSANDRLGGKELWKSEGSASTTTLIKDILPGNVGSQPNNFIRYKGETYFAATNELGSELWKSDGTSIGTVLVKDMTPGSGSSNPSNFCVVNNTLFFTVFNTVSGHQLWKTDGTTVGTVLVKEVKQTGSITTMYHFKELNGVLLFGCFVFGYAKDIWKSDGTTAGTVIVKDLNPIQYGLRGIVSGDIFKPVQLNNILYYVGANDNTGYKLVRSDGTASGTFVVKNVHPNNSNTPISYLTRINNNIFFVGTSDAYGGELWKSDGTDAGTVMVKDINPGTANSGITNIVQLGTKAIFAANNGTSGLELWISDGSDTGTIIIKDINPGTGSSNPSNFTTVGSHVYFYANDGTGGFDIWKTDGTNSGTVLVSELEGTLGSAASYPIVLSDTTLYVVGNTATTGLQLWGRSVSSEVVFTFTGNGNFNESSNWSNNMVPPNPVPAGVSVFINPQLNGSCTLPGNLTLLRGSSLVVNQGAIFNVMGNIITE